MAGPRQGHACLTRRRAQAKSDASLCRRGLKAKAFEVWELDCGDGVGHADTAQRALQLDYPAPARQRGLSSFRAHRFADDEVTNRLHRDASCAAYLDIL
jgi:hypothetical protein